MGRALAFEKIHTCGNDMILVEAPFERQLTAALCRRHHGVGADGVMIVVELTATKVVFDHLDPDGSSSFCLNGARAAVDCLQRKGMLAHWGTAVFKQMHFRFQRDRAGYVCFHLPPRPVKALTWRLNEQTEHEAQAIIGAYVDVGNPHFVIRQAAFNPTIDQLAPTIRADLQTFPHGANVHQLWPQADHWRIRSFERGVEGFTLACGSGVYAAALALTVDCELKQVRFIPDGGEWIEVVRHPNHLQISGPTHWSYSGVWQC